VITRDGIVDIIREAYRQFVPPGVEPGEVDENTSLLGSGSPLDSVGLVSLVVEVEQNLNDRCNTAITVADERAMSQKRSPFRTVGNLADYALMLLAERAA